MGPVPSRMRALIISDIHSNLEALNAVLATAPDHNVVWNLGDTVGYAANPNEVIYKLRQVKGISIRGNHDRACAGLGDNDDFSPIADCAVQWTRGVVTREHVRWLECLPEGPVSPGAADVSCVHGSPAGEDEYLFSADDALLAFQAGGARITFFGHTHQQVGFATDGEDLFRLEPLYSTDDAADEYELPLRRGFRYLLNPGSAGQPRDGDWRAAFAVYDEDRALFTWHRAPYDVSKTQDRIRRAGLPNFLADRLRAGR
jgi:diadenosine tetraphosphatase ApaH/serine/threonine PP2A family protein phosphatase